MRTSWQQDLERRFREIGLVDDMIGWAPYQDEEQNPKHESKLIQILTRSRYMFEDPHDVFLATYSAGRTELSGLELPHEAKTLADELTEGFKGNSHEKEDDDQSIQET